MTHELWRTAADRFVLLSLVQHLALYVVAGVFWARRRGMERIVDWYLASAFATAAAALLATPGARAAGVNALALAALWTRDALRPANSFSFATTPRLRLVLMAAVALWGALYPGYAEELPAFLFSPYGALLQPTLLVALAALNCAAAADRALRLALAASGLLWGTLGAVNEGLLTHAPLLFASAYAAALALGAGRKRAPSEDERSVRGIRDRMYRRWSILPGPQKPRYGRR